MKEIKFLGYCHDCRKVYGLATEQGQLLRCWNCGSNKTMYGVAKSLIEDGLKWDAHKCGCGEHNLQFGKHINQDDIIDELNAIIDCFNEEKIKALIAKIKKD